MNVNELHGKFQRTELGDHKPIIYKENTTQNIIYIDQRKSSIIFHYITQTNRDKQMINLQRKGNAESTCSIFRGRKELTRLNKEQKPNPRNASQQK